MNLLDKHLLQIHCNSYFLQKTKMGHILAWHLLSIKKHEKEIRK